MAVPVPPTGISQPPLHLAKTLAPRCPTIPLPASPSPRRQRGRPRQQEQAAGREVTPGRRRSRRARHPAQLKHILFGASCILPHPRAGSGGVVGQPEVSTLIAAWGTAGRGGHQPTALGSRCREGWVTPRS